MTGDWGEQVSSFRAAPEIDFNAVFYIVLTVQIISKYLTKRGMRREDGATAGWELNAPRKKIEVQERVSK